MVSKEKAQVHLKLLELIGKEMASFAHKKKLFLKERIIKKEREGFEELRN